MLKNSFFVIFVWSETDQKQSVFMKKDSFTCPSLSTLIPFSSTLNSNLQHPSLTTLSSTPHSLHSPAPFNHSTLQQPSITPLSSNLQSLHSPAPYNHSTLQRPSITLLSSTSRSIHSPAPLPHSAIQQPSRYYGKRAEREPKTCFFFAYSFRMERGTVLILT